MKGFSRFLVGMFLASLATLSFEVALSYEFAYVFWFYHSFLIITVAMFGLGLGGVAAFFIRGRWAYSSILFYSALVMGLSMPMILLALVYSGLESQYPLLAAAMVASAVPFFFSGACIGSGLSYPTVEKRRISYIYTADLTGAGTGCFVVLALIPYIGVEGSMILSALISVSATVFLADLRSIRRGLSLGFAVVLLTFLLLNASHLVPESSPDKFLARLKNDGATTLHTQWTPLSRVDVVEYQNGMIRLIENAIYPITASRGVGSDRVMNDPRYSMFLHQPRDMLAIGAGGGVEVAMALSSGVERVDAVEINPFIADYVSNDLSEYSNGLYGDPRVYLYVEDGRSFLYRSGEYDLIENGVLGSSGVAVPSTSMLTFEDIYVYTVEANVEYFGHMRDGGVTLTIIYGLLDDYNTVDPERGVTYFMLRQYNTVKEALTRVGVDPDKRFMLFRRIQPPDSLQARFAQEEYTFIFKDELTSQRVKEYLTWAAEHDLTPVYAPYYDGSLDLEGIIKTLPPGRDVSPATDDRPFFYYVYRGPPGELYLLLLILIFVTAVVIVLPVSRSQGLRREHGAFLTYFSALGLAYILVEVVVIQYLTLLLGSPAHAFQVALFAMLVFSGLGSMLSGRVVRNDERVHTAAVYAIVMVIGLIIFYAIGLYPTIQRMMSLPFLARMAVGVAILFPLATAMGAPYPLGLRIVSRLGGENVVWMYAVNAAGSIMGSIAAIMIALSLGFRTAMLFGGGFYLLALLAIMAGFARH
ncbi:MAG: hypothetical protein ACE5G7_01940 [Candidatus Hydrothermarchaeaceae archaeon]